MNTSRKIAISVGVLYLIVNFVLGPPGLILQTTMLDAPDYLVNLSANETRWMTAQLFLFMMAVGIACIGPMMYPILKQHNGIMAFLYAGRPLCPFGYAFTANGFDSARQRHKWFCDQACLKGITPVAPVDGTLYPPNECPFQTADHPHGKITNVGQRVADGSIRLVHDVPVGTPTWKRLYH
jgi:hypothetical protein